MKVWKEGKDEKGAKERRRSKDGSQVDKEGEKGGKKRTSADSRALDSVARSSNAERSLE